MSQLFLDKVSIPTDWTAQQARAIYEFLEQITGAVWDIHGESILNEIYPKNPNSQNDHKNTNSNNDDDLYPF